MPKNYRDKKWLRRKYWDDKKSSREIGLLCGVHGRTILRWMNRYKIPKRTLSEARSGKEHSAETRRKISEALRKYPPLVICVDCGQNKKHHALGLCASCCNRRWQEDHKEGRKIYKKRYRQEHREESSTQNRRWREENRDYNKARLSHWQKNNPEKVRASSCRRRARKRKSYISLTAGQTERLLIIGRLLYPGQELHLDHLVPLSKGGATTLANMKAIPATLNIAKADKLPEEVYEQLSF